MSKRERENKYNMDDDYDESTSESSSIYTENESEETSSDSEYDNINRSFQRSIFAYDDFLDEYKYMLEFNQTKHAKCTLALMTDLPPWDHENPLYE